jgi:hypothetical protein
MADISIAAVPYNRVKKSARKMKILRHLQAALRRCAGPYAQSDVMTLLQRSQSAGSRESFSAAS